MYSIDSIFGLNIGLNKFEYCPTKISRCSKLCLHQILIHFGGRV